MATQPKISIIEYLMIGGVGFVIYKVAKSGSLGGGVQDAAIDLCKSFMTEGACIASITPVDGSRYFGKGTPGSGLPGGPVPPGGTPGSGLPGGPVPPGDKPGGRVYPCGFVQDNGDGTFSAVKNYAPSGFTTLYTGTKAAAEQAFVASGLTWCK